MSKWPGKYIIGLTGNIATGKSVVRKMLEHLGAYTIDADSLAHRTYAKGAPGYQSVLDTFGQWVLKPDGEVDRSKLGRLAFSDSEAMRQLETIVHPLVEQAVDILIRRASQNVVVIEAIKLLESGLRSQVDTIWVVYAPEEIQVERLMRKRGLGREEALARIHSQPPQEQKIAAAKIVLRNTGSYEDLWKQVTAAWRQIYPATDTGPVTLKPVPKGELRVQRGRPRDSQHIAALLNRLSGKTKPLSTEDVMAAFGEKAYLLLQQGEQVVGVAGWQVENLVARVSDLYVAPDVPLEQALESLLKEVERASKELQCEAALIFPVAGLAAQENTWKKLGYERRTPQSLGVQAWTDAALESQPPGTLLFFKQLRQDRILRPI